MPIEKCPSRVQEHRLQASKQIQKQSQRLERYMLFKYTIGYTVQKQQNLIHRTLFLYILCSKVILCMECTGSRQYIYIYIFSVVRDPSTMMQDNVFQHCKMHVLITTIYLVSVTICHQYRRKVKLITKTIETCLKRVNIAMLK